MDRELGVNRTSRLVRLVVVEESGLLHRRLCLDVSIAIHRARRYLRLGTNRSLSLIFALSSPYADADSL